MPNIKSAKKRVLVSEKKALENKMYKSAFAQTAAMVHNKPFEVKEC